MQTGREFQLEEALRLYVVTDDRSDGDLLLPIIREAILGGATAIQLRRKRESGRQFLELAKAVRKITSELGAAFFVNDRVDIALLSNADGVHIGQKDMSCTDARKLMGDKWIGVSAVSYDEAKQAVEDGADYLGVGSIYHTVSKGDADLCGVQTLTDIAARFDIPIVAIGGIKDYHVADLTKRGADGIAIVSAVMGAPEPKFAAEALRELVNEGILLRG